jgi:hypothetical protein
MNREVADILFDSGMPHSLRGIGAALSTVPAGAAVRQAGVSGGAAGDLNFGEAMAAFMSDMAPADPGAPAQSAHSKTDVQVSRDHVTEQGGALPAASVKLADLLDTKSARANLADFMDEQQNIATLLAARDPEGVDLAAPGQLEVVVDEDMQEAPDGLQYVDFGDVPVVGIDMGSMVYV